MREMKRKPTTPGEILNEEFLKPLSWTQDKLATYLGCDVKVVNRIINGRTTVTAETAIKLAAAFGTSPEFWLNAQNAISLHEARKKVRRLPRTISSDEYDLSEDTETKKLAAGPYNKG
jgi:antitoxin HigA-1